MKRRKFITVLGGAAAWPLIAYAQEPKVRRVGALLIGNADMESFQKELREGLRELGYTEGQNIVFEFRSAEGILDRLPGLAAELVRLKVDVIVALYTPCGLAAKEATREIPIVLLTGDPLGTGLVTSLARPGGNITGLSMMAAETHGKLVELFRDMLPVIRHVAVLTNAADLLYSRSWFVNKLGWLAVLRVLKFSPSQYADLRNSRLPLLPWCEGMQRLWSFKAACPPNA